MTFLQTNPNIDILYIVGNHFSPWLKMQNRYLKIWLRLARINCQSFTILNGKVCQQSGHFHRKWRFPLWRREWFEHAGTKFDHQSSSEDAILRWSRGRPCTRSTVSDRQSPCGWQAIVHHFIIALVGLASAIRPPKALIRRSPYRGERERERERFRVKERGVQGKRER